MRFLLYAGHGLIDANIPTIAALRERLRREVARRPAIMSELYVLVFDRGDDRFLGRCGVMVQDGHPVLVRPDSDGYGTDQRSRSNAGWADDGRCVSP